MQNAFIYTEVSGQKLKLSNLEKELFEPGSYTKAEVIAYALEVAPLMLPHVQGRPLTLIRWPDGVGSKMFYTKNKPSWTPDWVPSTFVPWDEENEYLLANNAAHLVWLANLAALEVHTMNSNLAQINLPNQFIIDLDPPDHTHFDAVKELAFLLKDYLQHYDYQSFVKLSGGKGVHIVVPLIPNWDYETVMTSVKSLMKDFVAKHPHTTLFVHKTKRDSKILLDIYRNHAGNTTIAPYSTRGKVGAPVSLPITWHALTQIESAQAFDIQASLDYIRLHGDAWEGFWKAASTLHDQTTQIAVQSTSLLLDDYSAKRDFTKTNEPDPGANQIAEASVNGRFVVHLHHATNLHYDLRLGADNVLKSWAIPKGLPIEKGIKHLAIQTEDHPAKYIDFQGMIPKEEYGGGQMWIFDTGDVQYLKSTPKQYKFTLIGKSLQAMYNLYHIKDKEWIIEREESANLTPFLGIKPMLAESALELPKPMEQWLFEIKWDGIRATFYKKKQEVKLLSRSGRDLLGHFPEFQDPKFIRADNCIIDCELVCLDAAGAPVFSDIISRMHRLGKSAIDQAAKEKPAYMYAFDCLYLDGKNLVSYTLEQRREWLAAILRVGNTIRLSDAFEDGPQLLAAAKAMGLEGVMAKQRTGQYSPGARASTWRKIKFRETFDAFIIGFTKGKGDRVEVFGALHLAQLTDGVLKYFGKVGTGFDLEKIKEIYPKLAALPTIPKPIPDSIEEEERTIWVVPKYICDVTFASFASTGNLREPVFVRMYEAEEV